LYHETRDQRALHDEAGTVGSSSPLGNGIAVGVGTNQSREQACEYEKGTVSDTGAKKRKPGASSYTLTRISLSLYQTREQELPVRANREARLGSGQGAHLRGHGGVVQAQLPVLAAPPLTPGSCATTAHFSFFFGF
jgi:hypothetical protein